MKNFIFIAVGLLFAITASAQHKVVADKIVGIVGDKVILQSDITNAMLDMQRQGEQLPPEAECLILEQQLTIKALVMQSEKDSVMVDDAEIEALLDNQIRGFINAYGSKEALEEIAGRTVYQIKEDFRQNFKERKLMEKMRSKIVDNIKITPQEVKAYYDAIPKDSLAYIESELEIGEIVVYPKASRELEKMAMDDLADFKSQVESGRAKFEALAALYTDDPGSKNNGGQYSINRTEKTWDPSFINHAFRLKEGQISPVFKSKFGYHIVQMVSRAGDDAIVRHILLIPKVTDAEIQEAVNKLDTVRSQLIAGTLSFGEAVAKFSEDDNSKFTAGMRQGPRGSFLTIDQLDKDVALLLDNMKVGQYSQPKPFTDDRGKKAVRIVFLKSRTEPHRENLKDDYDRVAQRALEIKKQEALEKWFTEKIPSYYLLIDADYGQCRALQNWLQYAAKSGN
ncbi:MAG TPA: peptidylprolyl isomerase [Flavitalea sp.]|nr:peptidylprolyl isomerase [Flavitalea sp.]